MSGLKWFRAYSDIVDDDKLRLLAFEDRWHFVALCALKCEGLLDRTDDPLIERKVAVKMGVQQRELDEIKRRLVEVGLIDHNLHPVTWNKRQYKSPNLPDGENLDGFKAYIYFIADKGMKHVKIGFSKNPWARVKEFQTGRPEKLSVVATVKTTGISEADVHDLFSDERQAGEWFNISPRILSTIKQIKAKNLKTADDVIGYARGYVATKTTTRETDTETEKKEESSYEDRPSDDGPSLRPEHVFEGYQELAAALGRPVPRDLTPERRQLIKGRIAQYALDDFHAVFARCRGSPFLRGDKGRTPLTIDWLMKKGNFQKVLEGNYEH